MTGIAFVGTGFVADYYKTTLSNHPELKLIGVYDRAPAELQRFCAFYSVPGYPSLDAVLDDSRVDIVVNLTNPESHYEISRRALDKGKHVYSEKPLAMHREEAEALVRFAAEKDLCLAAAPANALSPAHTAVAAAIAAGDIGTPRLAYAELEDGAVFRDRWKVWRSLSGARWPGLHEFEIGCTLEHAGYALSWLTSLLGPVETLTAFSSLTFPDKGEGTRHLAMGPDFSVGCLKFASGAVARLTCGLAAPRDRSLTILGDAGTILVRDLWDHHSPVYLEKAGAPRSIADKVRGRIERRLANVLHLRPRPGRRLALPVETPRAQLPAFPSQIDFSRGVAAQAKAIANGGAPFFSGDVALHIAELALALSGAGEQAAPYEVRSTFSPALAAVQAPRR
ncbi:Gfo/Idh/MocA family protein [Arvimicrobium flavum]|uniref:Gfo/Idh/MocA family protein n=1 Tax=Arvimicrobium flavum TaxID=3393320 RepID=UPI00237A813A|nr:Gfo/Idh/MocA family oxidoreductase [Mesorhizobium shangrilense]